MLNGYESASIQNLSLLLRKSQRIQIKTPHLTFPSSCDLKLTSAAWQERGATASTGSNENIAKTLPSLATPGLCDGQKGFASSSQIFSFCSVHLEMNSPSGSSKYSGGKKSDVGGVGGKEACKRKCKDDKRKRDGEDEEQQRVESSTVESEFLGSIDDRTDVRGLWTQQHNTCVED